MAVTSLPTEMKVKQFDSKYFKEYLNKNWLKQFMGTGSNNMIQVREDLIKKPGDSITFNLVNKLTGAATDENGTLEGNEEAVSLRDFPMTIREYSHAVRWKKFDEQVTAIGLREAHKDVLMDWNMELDRDNLIRAMGSVNGVAYATANASQKNAWTADNADRLLFGSAVANYNATHATALLTIDAAADTLSSDNLSLMKRLAKTANPKIRPIKPRDGISRSDYYIFLAPSLLIRDLAADTAFKQANREARNRGLSNPIFKGADYVYDNIAIFEIEDIATIAGAGAAGIDVAPGYLMGAQALGIAWAMRPKTIGDKFDYDRQIGVSIQQYYEFDKLEFGTDGSANRTNPKDHGVFTGYFASVADA